MRYVFEKVLEQSGFPNLSCTCKDGDVFVGRFLTDEVGELESQRAFEIEGHV